MQKSKLVPKILVLTALIATVSLGWLAGHILRFSIPALWYPPIEENNPQIKSGYEFEFESIRRLVVLTEISTDPQAQIPLGEAQVNLFERCVGNTYYTSLPAKCRSMDGRLVRAGETPWEIILGP